MQTGDITARRMIRFNFGQYEEMVTELTITGIPGDADPDDISAHLDRLMEPEVIRASLATSHAEEDNRTSVYEWKKIVEGEYA